ncbi:MAG: hypothetical protein H8E30_03035 [Alphaproteobacteria bacterium]|nr:hypothetical protein [Alphaproteobacteria bacterium]
MLAPPAGLPMVLVLVPMRGAGRKIWLQGFLLIGFAMAFATAATLAVRHEAAESQAQESVLAETIEASEKAAAAIETRLRALMPATQAIADDLGSGKLKGSDLAARFARVLRDHPQVHGVGVAYEPHAYSKDIRLYAPFLVHQGEGPPKQVQLGDRLDYTDFTERWYLEPLLNGAMWTEPNSAKTGEALAEYAVPFYRSGDDPAQAAPIGIVYASYALADIKRFMGALDIDISGHQFVVSRQGRFIAHPRNDLVRAGKTLFELAWDSDDIAMYTLAIRAIKGERGQIDHADAVTGETDWIAFAPVAPAGWSIATVLAKGHLSDVNEERREFLHIVLAALLALLFLTAFVICFWPLTMTVAWAGATLTSVYCAFAVGVIWMVATAFPLQNEDTSEKIVNRTNLAHYLDAYRRESTGLKMEVPVFVPTGAFIQSIEFLSSNNVKVTGYIWQKYRRGVHRGLSRGFVLPEADQPVIKKVYHHALNDHSNRVAGGGKGVPFSASGMPAAGACRDADNVHKADGVPRDCSELIGWYFSATLRQNFSYELYPFDSQDVWLRLWHQDFDRNVVLTPDLDSFEFTNPAALPGVEQDFVLSGWTPKGAGFEYRRHGYNTNFGIERYVGQGSFPELYYSVHITRNFLGPFVLHFLPQFVVAALLFMILLMGSKVGDQAKWLGFTSKDVVRACSVLVIVLIFAHTALRRTLFSASLVYLEYFYLILYLSCIFVSSNSIMFATGKGRLLQYGDNLLPKLLFWPVVTGTIFAITLVLFY